MLVLVFVLLIVLVLVLVSMLSVGVGVFPNLLQHYDPNKRSSQRMTRSATKKNTCCNYPAKMR